MSNQDCNGGGQIKLYHTAPSSTPTPTPAHEVDRSPIVSSQPDTPPICTQRPTPDTILQGVSVSSHPTEEATTPRAPEESPVQAVTTPSAVQETTTPPSEQEVTAPSVQTVTTPPMLEATATSMQTVITPPVQEVITQSSGQEMFMPPSGLAATTQEVLPHFTEGGKSHEMQPNVKQDSSLKDQASDSSLKDQASENVNQDSSLKDQTSENVNQDSSLKDQASENVKQDSSLKDQASENVKQDSSLKDQASENVKQDSSLKDQASENVKQDSSLKDQASEKTKSQKSNDRWWNFFSKKKTVVSLKNIPTWEEDFTKTRSKNKFKSNNFKTKKVASNEKDWKGSPLCNPSLSKKVSLWRGDITTLQIDAIVNAANRSLLGGGGVDGAIHSAAGSDLLKECRKLGGCTTGDAKITSGYELPAKHVIHTVGPTDGNRDKLKSCYSRCLQLALENNISSLAFCCIATGIYGYPNKDAAHVALETVQEWLQRDGNADKIHRIVFCVFLDVDYEIYKSLLQKYFPVESQDQAISGKYHGHHEGFADGEGSGSDKDTGKHGGTAPSGSDKDTGSHGGTAPSGSDKDTGSHGGTAPSGSDESAGSHGGTAPSGSDKDTGSHGGTAPCGSDEGAGNHGGTAPSGSDEGAGNHGGTVPSGSDEGAGNHGGTAPSGSDEGAGNHGGSAPSGSDEGAGNHGGTAPSGSDEGAGTHGGTVPNSFPLVKDTPPPKALL